MSDKITLPKGDVETNQGIINFADYSDCNIVIYFYPKDNTPGCTLETQTFNQHLQTFKKANTMIFGVSRDSLKSHCKFADKLMLDFPLISDTDSMLCNHFEVIKPKKLYGKEYIGIERSTFLFDQQGQCREVWRNVRVKGHVEAVLAKVTHVNA